MKIFNIILIFMVLVGNGCKNQSSSPVPAAATDHPEKPAVSEMLRKLVEKEVGVAVALKFDDFKVVEDYAYVTGQMTQPNGKPMDFSQTQYKMAAEAGGFSDYVTGFLKKENGSWKVLAISVGATDVPSVCWWKEYSAPKILFPEGLAADDCEISAPFIYVENSGRIYVNGGIGLNLEEMKTQLVASLNRLDTIPQEVEVQFGDEVLMGTRQEVRTQIAEAIEEAKKD